MPRPVGPADSSCDLLKLLVSPRQVASSNRPLLTMRVRNFGGCCGLRRICNSGEPAGDLDLVPLSIEDRLTARIPYSERAHDNPEAQPQERKSPAHRQSDANDPQPTSQSGRAAATRSMLLPHAGHSPPGSGSGEGAALRLRFTQVVASRSQNDISYVSADFA
jgi:hypothetical protein